MNIFNKISAGVKKLFVPAHAKEIPITLNGSPALTPMAKARILQPQIRLAAPVKEALDNRKFGQVPYLVQTADQASANKGSIVMARTLEQAKRKVRMALRIMYPKASDSFHRRMRRTVTVRHFATFQANAA